MNLTEHTLRMMGISVHTVIVLSLIVVSPVTVLMMMILMINIDHVSRREMIVQTKKE